MRLDVLRGRVATLDVEASGLMRGGFPVEVAWASCAGNGSALVRPDDGWDARRWDPAAEAIHGISRSTLRRRGRPASQVAARLNEALRGRIAFSDSAEHDAAWLDMLHAAGGRPRTYRLLSVSRLLGHLGFDAATAQPIFEAAARTHPPRGRAEAGAAYLMAVFERASGEASR